MNAIGLSGSAESGAKLQSFVKNTATNQAVFTDSGLSTPASNPVVASSIGGLQVYLDGTKSYTLRLKTSDLSTTLFEVEYDSGTGLFTIVYATVPNFDSYMQALQDAVTALGDDLIAAIEQVADIDAEVVIVADAMEDVEIVADNIADVQAVAAAISGGSIPIDQSDIVILCSGQSNASFEYAYSWTVPDNLTRWNWSGTLGTVGTAFAAPTLMSLGNSFAAEVARANPYRKVRLINIAYGGAPIAAWLVGATPDDVYASVKANVEAALAVLGVTAIDAMLWWQGETDAVAGNTAGYPANFETLHARFRAETWWKYETPVVIMGTSILNASTLVRDFNAALTAVVAAEPDTRTYVYTGILPTSYWDPSVPLSPYLHMLAVGYDAAGRMGASAYLGHSRRASQQGISVDPYSGNVTSKAPKWTLGNSANVQIVQAGTAYGLSINGGSSITDGAGLSLTGSTAGLPARGSLSSGAVEAVNWNATSVGIPNNLTIGKAATDYSISHAVATQSVYLNGGTGNSNGAGVLLNGGSHGTFPGQGALASGGVASLGWSSSLITATVPIQATTIELGATSDTTISRVSAGVIAVEGATIATQNYVTAGFQPLDADTTSWASVSRASGFDTFAATPTSANLAALVTNETGSGALVFGTSPTLTASAVLGSAGNTFSFLHGGTDSTLYLNGGTSITNGAGIALNGSTQSPFPGNGSLTSGATSVLGWTASLITAAVPVQVTTAGTPARFTNTTDTGSVIGLIIEGDRATPTASDILQFDWMLSDSAGNQDIFGRIDLVASDVTSTSEDSYFRMYARVAGSLTNMYRFTHGAFRPDSNDQHALGTATVSWADLFLANGGVINFNNGNLTVTHNNTNSNLLVAAASGSAPLSVRNTTDAANNLGLIIESDRATPAANDNVTLEMRVSDSAGNQDPAVILRALFTSVTSGAETSRLDFFTYSGGTSANRMVLSSNSLSPATNDSSALGTTSLMWSDVFLASGGVVNFNNGNYTLTHSAGLLTASGALTVAGVVTHSNASAVVGAAGTDHAITHAATDRSVYLQGGNTTSNGAGIVLNGGSHAVFPNQGALTVGGTAILSFASAIATFSVAVKTLSTTVAGLPAAATAGASARAYVTDAAVGAFGTVVAGGSSNGVPVYSDGTNWRIG